MFGWRYAWSRAHSPLVAGLSLLSPFRRSRLRAHRILSTSRNPCPRRILAYLPILPILSLNGVAPCINLRKSLTPPAITRLWWFPEYVGSPDGSGSVPALPGSRRTTRRYAGNHARRSSPYYYEAARPPWCPAPHTGNRDRHPPRQSRIDRARESSRSTGCLHRVR